MIPIKLIKAIHEKTYVCCPKVRKVLIRVSREPKVVAEIEPARRIAEYARDHSSGKTIGMRDGHWWRRSYRRAFNRPDCDFCSREPLFQKKKVKST